jgi:hypothetical protein
VASVAVSTPNSLAELPVPMCIAAVAAFRYFDTHETIVRQRRADP